MNENVRKVLVGAVLAAVGAGIGFVSDAATGGAFGSYSVIVAAVASIAINAIRKFAPEPPEPTSFSVLAVVMTLAFAGSASAQTLTVPPAHPLDERVAQLEYRVAALETVASKPGQPARCPTGNPACICGKCDCKSCDAHCFLPGGPGVAAAPAVAAIIPAGYGRIDSGPNAGQLIRLSPPAPAPAAPGRAAFGVPAASRCYTDPATGRTVCPLQR